jgi:hypothetical protein
MYQVHPFQGFQERLRHLINAVRKEGLRDCYTTVTPLLEEVTQRDDYRGVFLATREHNAEALLEALQSVRLWNEQMNSAISLTTAFIVARSHPGSQNKAAGHLSARQARLAEPLPPAIAVCPRNRRRSRPRPGAVGRFRGRVSGDVPRAAGRAEEAEGVGLERRARAASSSMFLSHLLTSVEKPVFLI